MNKLYRDEYSYHCITDDDFDFEDDVQTVQTDTIETTFTVTVRTMGAVDVNDIKDQLQKRYEVTDVQKTDRVVNVVPV